MGLCSETLMRLSYIVPRVNVIGLLVKCLTSLALKYNEYKELALLAKILKLLKLITYLCDFIKKYMK